MKIITLIAALCLPLTALFAQNDLQVKVTDADSGEPLPGVSVLMPALSKGDITNTEGLVALTGIPDGTHVVRCSYVGYETFQQKITFPLTGVDNQLAIQLEHSHEEMEEVIITSTRSSRTIEDIPTRVEFIAGEELSEKGNMKPGDIRMLLNESTGIQTQQTSATSYNSSIRIQGLDGKYTQLLRDGLPLYSGFSGGLSLMQIAPLDLKQVEVIKGSSSTLYGGGAIAGLVNLISKRPEEEPELSFMLNGTSALGLDVSGFYAEKYGKAGVTVFSSFNKGTPYDPADIGLTAIPRFDRFTLNPRLFLYPDERTELSVGANFVTEDRLGGNMDYIKGNDVTDPYHEANATTRLSSQVLFSRELAERQQLSFKNSVSHYNRAVEIPEFRFAGVQLSSFTEASYSASTATAEWVGGLNLWTEKFTQLDTGDSTSLDFSNTTAGAFIQNTWRPSHSWAFESGLRLDSQSDYGWFLLPRLSVMAKPTAALTLRLGGGLGYKTPTVFTEDAERLQFRNVLPIDPNQASAERSAGGNFDINYRFAFSENLSLSLNTLWFYTQITDPLLLQPVDDFYRFLQPAGKVDTKGVEMNMKWSFHDLKLFVGYTLSDVREHYNGSESVFPLVAKHRLNNVLMYEKHEQFWIGLEAYYFSSQQLNDGTTGQPYWIVGLMTEKTLGEHFSVFLNLENFTDTRQTAFDTIFIGPISNPEFRDIYAPVDGFVINGGAKVRF